MSQSKTNGGTIMRDRTSSCGTRKRMRSNWSESSDAETLSPENKKANGLPIMHPTRERLRTRTSDDFEKGESSFSGGSWGNAVNSDVDSPKELKRQRKLEEIMRKIEATREQIRKEQMSRDDNVDEYLRLADSLSTDSAENPQILRVRQMFERKNCKTAQNILHAQKKLSIYMKRLQDIEAGSPGESTRLDSLGRNIRNVMGSVPRGFSHMLLRQKSGSAGNIPDATEEGDLPTGPALRRRRSLCEGDSIFYTGGITNISKMPSSCVNLGPLRRRSLSETMVDDGAGRANSCPITKGSPHSRFDPCIKGTGDASAAARSVVASVLKEIEEIKRTIDHLSSALDSIRQQVQREYAYFHRALYEERCRHQKLEDQLNDLTELHQAEMLNLKQEITSMEDKTDYQNRERLRDLHDAIENAQTRVSKIEHSQQLLSLERFQPTSSMFALKAFNALIIVLQCILVIIATFAQFVTPFVKSRLRVVTTTVILVLIIALIRHRNELHEHLIWLPTATEQNGSAG